MLLLLMTTALAMDAPRPPAGVTELTDRNGQPTGKVRWTEPMTDPGCEHPKRGPMGGPIWCPKCSALHRIGTQTTKSYWETQRAVANIAHEEREPGLELCCIPLSVPCGAVAGLAQCMEGTVQETKRIKMRTKRVMVAGPDNSEFILDVKWSPTYHEEMAWPQLKEGCRRFFGHGINVDEIRFEVIPNGFANKGLHTVGRTELTQNKPLYEQLETGDRIFCRVGDTKLGDERPANEFIKLAQAGLKGASLRAKREAKVANDTDLSRQEFTVEDIKKLATAGGC